MLTELGTLPEGLRSVEICSVAAIVPALRFQGVYHVLTAHQVDKAPAQILRKVDVLMLRVEAQDGFAALEDVAEKQLEQIRFALAAVAEDEAAGVRLIVVALVQIHEDVAAKLVPPDVEPMRVRLARIIEGVQVGDRAGGQNALELSAEHIATAGADAQEPLLLTEQESVHVELASYQFRQHVGLKQLEGVVLMGNELDINRAMQERFAVAVHGGDQRRHILQVALGCDGLLEVVGVGAGHAVFVGGVMDDSLFLCGSDLPGIDPERDAVLFTEVAQDGLLVCGRRILPQRPYATVGVAADDVVGIKLDDPRRDHVEELFDMSFLRRGDVSFAVLTQNRYLLYPLREVSLAMAVGRISPTAI